MKYLKSFNESNNIKVINNLQELSEYIEEYYPNIWNLVHGSAHTAMEVLGSDIEDDDELGLEHIGEESWKQGVESFYDGHLLDEVSDGNLKINLPKEQVLAWISDRCSAGSGP